MKKCNKIVIFLMLIAVVSTCLVACTPSNKKLIDDVNAEIKGDSVVDAPMGSYTLPTVSAKLAKAGVTVEYLVYDHFGNVIDDKDGKFEIRAGGEYTIEIDVRNKAGGFIVDKTIRVTENSTLSHKMSEKDFVALAAKRDSVIIEIFDRYNVKYDAFKQLSYQDMTYVDSFDILNLIDRLLSDDFLGSGLSKNMLSTVFDNVSAMFKAVDDETIKGENVPKILKELFDKALAPVFSGAESSIVLASIAYDQYLNYAQSNVDAYQAQYDAFEASEKAAKAAKAMSYDEKLAYLKEMKANVELQMAELLEYENAGHGDDAYAAKLYNLIAESGAMPVLSPAELDKVFTENIPFKNQLIKLKASAIRTADLFNILVGAELYSDPKYKALMVTYDMYKENTFPPQSAFDVYTDGKAHKSCSDYSKATLNALKIVPQIYFAGLQNAVTNDEFSKSIKGWGEIADGVSNHDTCHYMREDLDNAKAMLEDVKADEETILESVAMMVKISEVVSPIVNSNIAKELIIYSACKALNVEYTTEFFDKDTNKIDYNVADLSAILTSVSGKVDKFVAKYSMQLDTLDADMMKVAGNVLTGMLNRSNIVELENDAINNIISKHLTVSKTLMSTIKQVIVMVNTTDTIDYFVEALSKPAAEQNADEKYLSEVNQYVASSVVIKNLIDVSKADMTIDQYIASIKKDILDNKAVAELLPEKDVDKYLGKIKEAYELSGLTLAATEDKFVIAIPADAAAFKLVLDPLMTRWTELSKKV